MQSKQLKKDDKSYSSSKLRINTENVPPSDKHLKLRQPVYQLRLFSKKQSIDSCETKNTNRDHSQNFKLNRDFSNDKKLIDSRKGSLLEKPPTTTLQKTASNKNVLQNKNEKYFTLKSAEKKSSGNINIQKNYIKSTVKANSPKGKMALKNSKTDQKLKQKIPLPVSAQPCKKLNFFGDQEQVNVEPKKSEEAAWLAGVIDQALDEKKKKLQTISEENNSLLNVIENIQQEIFLIQEKRAELEGEHKFSHEFSDRLTKDHNEANSIYLMLRSEIENLKDVVKIEYESLKNKKINHEQKIYELQQRRCATQMYEETELQNMVIEFEDKENFRESLQDQCDMLQQKLRENLTNYLKKQDTHQFLIQQ